jgi:hypothetical protein
MSEQLLERLVTALEGLEGDETKEMHQKVVGSAHAGALLTQPGGMFSIAGIEQNVVSTHVAPMGLGAALPAFGSNIDSVQKQPILVMTHRMLT